MKLIKSYTFVDADGIQAEKKFSQTDHDGVDIQFSLGTKLIPFAMDTEHQELIVFMISRPQKSNLFVWVYLLGNYHDKKVRITNFLELAQYTKWSGEPMDVGGKYPEEVIVAAIQILQAWTLEEAQAEYLELQEVLKHRADSNLLRSMEESMLAEVKRAKKENGGIMYMY